MKHKLMPTVVSVAVGLVLWCHAGGSDAQSVLATGADAEITEDGLHRVNPLIMDAAWVKPDLDLSRYTRVFLVPTGVQFRDVPRRPLNARSRISASEFPLSDERKAWLRRLWQQTVEAEFAQEKTYALYEGVGSDVLVVQALLVDVVCRIPPDDVGSDYMLVSDPWMASVVLELRDGMTAELLARTIDRRYGQGLLEVGEVWYQTEDLVERWAQVLSARLDQLTALGGGRGRMTPSWAR